MKRLTIALIIASAGMTLLLAGLGVDAYLHAQDPTLAEREGVFTVANPGHALLAAGVALAAGGLLVALHAAWGMWDAPGVLGRPYARTLATRALARAAAGALAFTLYASGGEHTHPADATTAHAHDNTAMSADGAPVEAQAETMAAAADAAPAAEGDTESAAHAHAPDVMAAPAQAAAAQASPHRHDHGVTGEPTAEERACADELAARVREATARFADYDVAAAEGYRNYNGGTHYGNAQYRRDGKTMDLAHPEAVIYYENATGKHLVGVLFMMPRGIDGPQPCGAATVWHTHPHCIDPATRAEVAMLPDGTCAEGAVLFEGAQMMHAWLVPHPKGPFGGSMPVRVVKAMFG